MAARRNTSLNFCQIVCPDGPARHLDASRQKLTPHCLEAIFDSQLPSPKLSLKMPPKLPLPHSRAHFFPFQNCPRGEGNCAAIERQNCLAAIFASRHQDASLGPLGAPDPKTRPNHIRPTSEPHPNHRNMSDPQPSCIRNSGRKLREKWFLASQSPSQRCGSVLSIVVAL